MTQFTIGADPEIFVKDPSGAFVSAHNLVPGDKHNPYKVKDGAIQVDGMALEFNVDPSASYEEFQAKLDSVRELLSSMIGDKQFLAECSVKFDEDFIKDIPLENLLLGCEPDYNGWTLDENPPVNPRNLMRTAGGHVHIGGFFPEDSPFEKDHFNKCGRLARILDEVLGIPSLSWDNNDERREMYGKAGCFRPKPYGMEYRTLSNAWIFSPHLVRFVYSQVEKAMQLFHSDYEPSEEVRSVIDTSNRNHPLFIEGVKP